MGTANSPEIWFAATLGHQRRRSAVMPPGGGRMNLEWQLNDTRPVPDEDCGSVLPDVAERAKEVIPVQHRSRIIHVSLLHGEAIAPSR